MLDTALREGEEWKELAQDRDDTCQRLRAERDRARKELSDTAKQRDDLLARCRLMEEEMMAMQANARQASAAVSSMLTPIAHAQRRLTAIVFDEDARPPPPKSP